MKKDVDNTGVLLAESLTEWENGTTNEDGPRPAASTAGSSRGLADSTLRSVD